MKIHKAFVVVAMIGLAACTETLLEPPPAAEQANMVVKPGGFHILINQARTKRGLGPLLVSAQLNQAALGHANDMSRGGFFSHTGSDGQSVGARVAATGYGHCWVSENISWNRKSEAEAFARWMASPGHRDNMLADEPTEYGIAVASGNYRVLILAVSGC